MKLTICLLTVFCLSVMTAQEQKEKEKKTANDEDISVFLRRKPFLRWMSLIESFTSPG
jgi:hypothetical protein